jgi:hypothetical protein
MGFNNTGTTITLTAHLTPFGRKQLVQSNAGLITHFSLGDTDANYYASESLTTGEVPASAGLIGPFGALNNSTTPNTKIRSNLYSNDAENKFKLVELGSTNVNELTTLDGIKIITSGFTQETIDRTIIGTGSTKTNLFHTFGLPITETEKNQFSGITSDNGGFSDTALSGFNQDQVTYIAIDNAEFGESIDGKSIQLDLNTTGGTVSLYGTFQQTLTTKSVLDKEVREKAVGSELFGTDVVYLFSDSIKRPQGVATKSWATGSNSVKPFTLHNKELFQFKNSTGITGDTAVGIAFLDKGFIVITEPTLIVGTATTVTFNTLTTEIFQSITIVANRGEFAKSNNSTFEDGDIVRISEIGLHDSGGNLIAIAKPDRHILKPINELITMSIKIVL